MVGVFFVFFFNTRFFINLINTKLLELNLFKNYVKIFSFLANKWYFDVIYNKLINYNILHFGHRVTFELIDKGLLEILGPHGL
jgi:hypothetical protein